jgi:hypothetical protein
MPKFTSREEYEKWKAEKINEDKRKKEIEEAKRTERKEKFQKIRDTLSRLDRKKLILVLVAIVTISVLIYSYAYIYKPKNVAEQYLEATQLHDFETLGKLSSYLHLLDLEKKGVLINLINWQFVDKKNTSIGGFRLIEYLLDITATNKLGTRIEKKYVLEVERYKGEWKVSEFKER